MPVDTVRDKGGDTIRFMKVAGIRYPYVNDNMEEGMKSSRDLQPLDDDIILISYVKSGTHWMWEILTMLQNGKAETIPKIKQANMIECLSYNELKEIPSPRVLNAHYRYDQLPSAMKERKTRIVLCLRNPKDVAVSLYNHHYGLKSIYNYDGKWENWLPLYTEGEYDYGSFFDYVLDWERAIKDNTDHPIHVVMFEDMKQNGPEEVMKLAKKLNINASDELCHAIAEKCEFKNMKKDKKQYATEYWNKAWRSEEYSYYRKGEVGDWKNKFTVSQNEQFDQIYQEKMKDSKIKFKFE